VNESTIYPLPLAPRLLCLVGAAVASVLALLGLVALLWGGTPAARPGVLTFAMLFHCVLWLLVLVLCVLTLRMRLIVSPQGITYHGMLHTCHTSWDNIERVGRIARRGSIRQGLLLSQPVPSQGVPGWGAVPCRALPLTVLGSWWGEGAIEHILRRYAPHLFASSDA
jgi:hypothetical protein